MKYIILLLSVVFSLELCAQNSPDRKIAVLDFKAGQEASQNDVDGMSAMFGAYFAPQGFTLADRGDIDRAMTELQIPRTGMTDDQTVRIGQALGLDNIVTGTITFAGGKYNADICVMDVRSGRAALTVTADWNREQPYRDVMQNIARQLAANIPAAAQSAAATPAAAAAPAAQQTQPQQPQQNTEPAPTAPQQGGTQEQAGKVYVLYGYIKVFPKDLGRISNIPASTIENINKQGSYGYSSWRLPTKEEIELITSAIDGMAAPSEYMYTGNSSADDHTSGYVRLVTTEPTNAATANEIAVTKSRRPIVLFEYLKIFPNDLGMFSAVPQTIIDNINRLCVYGYDSWRLPTPEEDQIIRSNPDIVKDYIDAYMTSEYQQQSKIRLVTNGQPVAAAANAAPADNTAAANATEADATAETAAAAAAAETEAAPDQAGSIHLDLTQTPAQAGGSGSGAQQTQTASSDISIKINTGAAQQDGGAGTAAAAGNAGDVRINVTGAQTEAAATAAGQPQGAAVAAAPATPATPDAAALKRGDYYNVNGVEGIVIVEKKPETNNRGLILALKEETARHGDLKKHMTNGWRQPTWNEAVVAVDLFYNSQANTPPEVSYIPMNLQNGRYWISNDGGYSFFMMTISMADGKILMESDNNAEGATASFRAVYEF